MEDKTFSVRQYVGYQSIADILLSGVEGCSYWGDARVLAYERNVMAILGDSKKMLTVYDHEAEEKPVKHSLTLGKVKKGLQILAKKYPHHWAAILEENTDMYTADAIVQCALFGDIIYG